MRMHPSAMLRHRAPKTCHCIPLLWTLLSALLLQESVRGEPSKCGIVYPWIEPAVQDHAAKWLQDAKRSTETTEESLEELKKIRWGEHHPGTEQVTLSLNSNGMVEMNITRISNPNVEYKPKGILKVFRDALGRHNSEFAQLIKGRSELKFMLMTEDQPTVWRDQGRKMTLLSMCRDEGTTDLPVPDFTFEVYPETGYAETSFWAVRDLLLAKATMVPWEKRRNHVFMRHFQGIGYRKTLYPVLLAHQDNGTDLEELGARVNIRDSGFVTSNTNNFEWLDNWCTFKYLLHTGGLSYSASLKYKMACASVIFMFESKYKEFYYPALKDGQHYYSLPEGNKEALQSKILPKMRNKIKEMEASHETHPEVAQNAQDFIDKQLTEEAVHCYWLKLLIAYSRVYYSNSVSEIPDSIDFTL